MSVFAVLYLSSQTATVFVSEELSASLRGVESVRTPSILDPPIEKEEFPAPENNVYYDQMEAHTAERSLLHQRKFLARKDRITSKFDYLVRFQAKLDQYAAIIVSETFSFLHIWKCGGTTVAALAGDMQWDLNNTEIQRREWVAFVRDPIDRFLSAWAECGFRQLQNTTEYQAIHHHTVLNWLDGEYDFRVRAFLNEVKDFTYPEPDLSCHTHAFPQANYMMNENRAIDDHVTMVGDLSELRPVLEIAGFKDFSDEVKSRDASSNTVKAEKFPARRDLLRDQTLIELCRFYAMDYYLFDFDPPTVCLQPGGPLARYH